MRAAKMHEKPGHAAFILCLQESGRDDISPQSTSLDFSLVKTTMQETRRMQEVTIVLYSKFGVIFYISRHPLQ